MVHHGKNLTRIAKEKGYNKSQLGRLLGKSPQAVDYDFKRENLSNEVLKKYSEVLEVDLEIILNSTGVVKDNLYKEKYFSLLEEMNNLKTWLLRKGISLQDVNFKLGVPTPVILSI